MRIPMTDTYRLRWAQGLIDSANDELHPESVLLRKPPGRGRGFGSHRLIAHRRALLHAVIDAYGLTVTAAARLLGYQVGSGHDALRVHQLAHDARPDSVEVAVCAEHYALATYMIDEDLSMFAEAGFTGPLNTVWSDYVMGLTDSYDPVAGRAER